MLDRVPEMSEETYDKLPDGVKDKVPEQAKPKKKRRLRKLAAVGLVAGAGAREVPALTGQIASERGLVGEAISLDLGDQGGIERPELDLGTELEEGVRGQA